MNGVRIFIFAVLIASLSPSQARAWIFVDGIRQYTMEFPEGWYKASAQTRGNVAGVSFDFFHPNSLERGLFSERITQIFLHTNFRIRDQAALMYIREHPEDLRGASFDDIKKRISSDFSFPIIDSEDSIKDLCNDLPYEEIAFDQGRCRYVFKKKFKAKKEPYELLFISKISSKGRLDLIFAAPEKDFARMLPDFLRINESFTFKLGEEFVPGEGHTSGTALMLWIGVPIAIVTIVLLVMSGLSRRSRTPTNQFFS